MPGLNPLQVAIGYRPAMRMPSLAGIVITVALAACGGAAQTAPARPVEPPAPTTCDASHATLLVPSPTEPDRAELEKRIQRLEAELAARERDSAQAASEIVIALEGPVLTVQAAKPGEVRGIDDKTALVASRTFIDVVGRSRAEIQSCYQAALKANTALASKMVSLVISATFTSGGAYQRSTTSPSLGATFDDCLRLVIAGWKVPGLTSATTFKAQISLRP